MKDYKLIVAGIKAKPYLQAKLFREINEFQKKINRNLLLDLYDYLDIDDDKRILLRIRVAKKLRKLPLFEGKIKILRTEKGRITLANIVDYSKFIDIVKINGKKSYTLLRRYFKAVNDTFPKEWENPKRYVFATNKGIRMLLSLLTRIIWYCNNNKKKLDYKNMKLCLEALKEACEAEKDYFLVKTYTGKALGAGSPDIAARDLWAARIDEKFGNFLSEHEKALIAGHAERFLEALETKLRECIETQLKMISKRNWWKERVPPDVRGFAEERKIKNEKIWPWYKAEDQPLICYLDFSDYIKIIQKRDNWPVFQPIFRDQDIVVAKMKELKPIRDSIAHHRKLTADKRERLKMYSTDLITCIDKALTK